MFERCSESPLATRAFENSVYAGVANKVGVEDAFDFCGKRLAIDPFGRVIIAADDVAEDVFMADPDLGPSAFRQQDLPSLSRRRPDLHRRLVEATDTWC